MNRQALRAARTLPAWLADMPLRSAGGLSTLDWLILLAQKRSTPIASHDLFPHPFVDIEPAGGYTPSRNTNSGNSGSGPHNRRPTLPGDKDGRSK